MYWLVFNKWSETQGAQFSSGGSLVAMPAQVSQIRIVPAIFRADTAEQACQAAAKKMGSMGTYFAVEGTPWGVDLVDVEGVEELGAPETEDAKERRIRALERSVLDHDVPQ